VNRIHEDPKGTLAMINDKLHGLSVDISQNQMNDIISEMNFNFTDAAIETFGKIGQRRKWKQDDSKPWFDNNCLKNRKKNHKARKRYSFLKNAENRRNMTLASKEYKVSLNRAFTEY
jgi:ADP-heptose:LPS heptosyltransferase